MAAAVCGAGAPLRARNGGHKSFDDQPPFGKIMAPATIDAAVKTGSPLSDEPPACESVALIARDAPALAFFAQRHDLSSAALHTLAAEVRVREQSAAGGQQANERLGSTASGSRCGLLPGSPAGMSLAPRMKLARPVIGEKDAAYIKTLYAA